MNITRILLAESSALSVPLCKPGILRRATHDAVTFDQATIDSSGVFLIGQLERFDPKLNMPLLTTTWSRDVDIRSDVSFADDSASFALASFSAPGGVKPTGKNWIGSNTNAIAGPNVDIGRVVQPLHPWGMELGWTIRELDKSQKLNMPIDQQKLVAMNMKHNMDCDEQVYVGDTDIPNCFGLLNSPLVPTVIAAPNGAAGTPQWATKTPMEMLADLNSLITAIYIASGYTSAPTHLRLPPVQFAKLASQVLSVSGTTGSTSVISYLRDNSVANAINGRPLDIQPLKWGVGTGVGGTDRAVAYTKSEDRVRFPMVPLQRTPLEFRSLWQMVTYYGSLGQLEFPYPETIGYLDGI